MTDRKNKDQASTLAGDTAVEDSSDATASKKATDTDIDQIQNRSSHIHLYDRTAMATPAATITLPAARLSCR